MEKTDKQETLIKILKGMFQFDQADLDFGVYRIMNMKHNEISAFLDYTLPKQINEELARLVSTHDTDEIEKLEKAILSNRGLGVSTSELEVKLSEKKSKIIDSSAFESDIYNHLCEFFSRYYDDGDFISERRYSNGTYAIPYDGEEVKLHWANADQYYVKTSEYFKEYSFKLGEATVVFKIVDAETEKDNNKAKEKRYFQLNAEKSHEFKGHTLTIYLVYKVDENKAKETESEEKGKKRKKQAEFNYQIIDAVKEDCMKRHLFAALFELDDKGRTKLERQLDRYTAKNTFDYFIHKDLKNFLERELDFYIKTEVLFIDDLDAQSQQKSWAYIVKTQIIKFIGHKIIEFLAQIEDFQKKLYLKKKFVVETNYCITLDRIPESFFLEIIENEKQHEEWIKLFAIDKITGDLTKKGYSKPLTIDFLKENTFLVLDTAFFGMDFKERLISEIDNLDENLDGLLIHSENFQALNLLQEKYKAQIKCVYIDPPYNTGSDGFLYKDNYQHSSWLSFMKNRLLQAKEKLCDNGVIFISIDDNEVGNLRSLCAEIFGENSFIGSVGWESKTKSQNTQDAYDKLQPKMEYILLYNKGGKHRFNLYGKGEKQYPMRDAQGEYREHILELMNATGIRGRDSMVFEIEGVIPPSGKQWQLGQDEVATHKSNGNLFIRDGKVIIKMRPQDERSEITEPFWAFFPKEFGTAESAKKELNQSLPNHGIETIKPVEIVKRIVFHATTDKDMVLDFFCGSGTTANAVIQLNRESKDKRNFILVEMSEYFDTVTKPCIQKVVYSDEWKDGKPTTRKGSSHAFKYIRLESYEDTLNNIEFSNITFFTEQMKEEHFLRYMLDRESTGSQCLLSIGEIKNPFDYKLNITRKNESKPVIVDLIETFNYLIGLKINRNHAKQEFNAEIKEDEQYKALIITLKKGKDYTFKTIEGTLPNGNNALVIWRTLSSDLEKDNAVLDEYFKRFESKYKNIYVNGDCNISEALLIEDEMKTRLFSEV